MSISQNFPEEGPTLNLNFAGSKTLDPHITFSKTSIGTYMDDSGLIKVALPEALQEFVVEPQNPHRVFA